MARQCAVLALALMIPGFAASAFAETIPASKAETTKVGFVNYYLVHAERGPNWKALNDEESRTAGLALIEDLKAALGSGQVTFSGVVNNAGGEKIMAIIRTGDEAEMRRTLQQTKSVTNGLFELRVRPWYSPLSTWPDADGNTDGC